MTLEQSYPCAGPDTRPSLCPMSHDPSSGLLMTLPPHPSHDQTYLSICIHIIQHIHPTLLLIFSTCELFSNGFSSLDTEQCQAGVRQRRHNLSRTFKYRWRWGILAGDSSSGIKIRLCLASVLYHQHVFLHQCIKVL